MEIHLAILVSSAAEGFRRSGSSRQCFAASMSVFVKLKLVGDFIFCCFVISFGVVSLLFGLSALQFELSFLSVAFAVLDMLFWMCLYIFKHLAEYFLFFHKKDLPSSTVMEFRFWIRVFGLVVGTSSMLWGLKCLVLCWVHL